MCVGGGGGGGGGQGAGARGAGGGLGTGFNGIHICSCQGGPGSSPDNFEFLDCRRSHLTQFNIFFRLVLFQIILCVLSFIFSNQYGKWSVFSN